jgi:hypothetical protein
MEKTGKYATENATSMQISETKREWEMKMAYMEHSIYSIMQIRLNYA